MLTHPTGLFSGDYISVGFNAVLVFFVMCVSRLRTLDDVVVFYGNVHAFLRCLFLGDFHAAVCH